MQKIFKDRNRIIRLFGWLICNIVFCQWQIVYCQGSDNDRNKIHTVVLDAGHGGKDPGALGKNAKEKDIALAICLKLGEYIKEKIPDIKVVYTRKTDEFIPLYERAKIANDNKADLFISIHVNANTSSDPYGPSTHVLGLHRSDENFEVAKRENSVILLEDDYTTRYENFDPNSPESYIMFSLLQNVYFDQSLNFAQLTQDQFRNRAKRNDRGIIQQGLLVLAQSSMPGVLIESGFISNPDEEKFLMSEQGQEIISSAIFRAFREYKDAIEGNSSSPDEPFVSPVVSAPSNQVIADNPVNPVSNAISVNGSSLTHSSHPANSIVPLNSKIDSTIVYKVQILYSQSRVDLANEMFKDFSDVEEINVSGKYKYVVGSNKSYGDAIEYSKWVKSRYPDAFIVAISNGKIIPLSQAIKTAE